MAPISEKQTINSIPFILSDLLKKKSRKHRIINIGMHSLKKIKNSGFLYLLNLKKREKNDGLKAKKQNTVTKCLFSKYLFCVKKEPGILLLSRYITNRCKGNNI
ncbi:MAG: hypothetical protein ACOCUQ_01155 [Bacteroidota bacterium]